MPSTRRQFVCSSTVLLAGISGCASRSDTKSIQELRLNILNQTNSSLTFHFVLEADGKLGQWQQFELDAGAERQVNYQPATDKTWSRYHAVAGDNQVSGTLLGQGDERVCLELDYRIQADQIVSTLPTDQTLCADD